MLNPLEDSLTIPPNVRIEIKLTSEKGEETKLVNLKAPVESVLIYSIVLFEKQPELIEVKLPE